MYMYMYIVELIQFCAYVRDMYCDSCKIHVFVTCHAIRILTQQGMQDI